MLPLFLPLVKNCGVRLALLPSSDFEIARNIEPDHPYPSPEPLHIQGIQNGILYLMPQLKTRNLFSCRPFYSKMDSVGAGLVPTL